MTPLPGSAWMFREPEFFLTLRREVCPLLRTYPSVRVWLPLSSTGEDAYATAIVLREEGLYQRTHIYATDADEAGLDLAREGTYPLDALAEAAADYLKAGGIASLAEYYARDGASAVIRPLLRERITFTHYNLETDASFNEFQLIVCRGATTRLEPVMRRRAYGVFHESLCRFGILGFGPGDSFSPHPHEDSYELLLEGTTLFRRVR